MKVKMKLEWVIDLDDVDALSLSEIEDNFENDESTYNFCGQGLPISDIKCTATLLGDSNG